jgi:hypothetical protein
MPPCAAVAFVVHAVVDLHLPRVTVALIAFHFGDVLLISPAMETAVATDAPYRRDDADWRLAYLRISLAHGPSSHAFARSWPSFVQADRSASVFAFAVHA